MEIENGQAEVYHKDESAFFLNHDIANGLFLPCLDSDDEIA
jgi:hypothetical protein